MFCPRCAARNEGSPAFIAIRVLTVVLVATAISSTYFLLTKKEQYSGSGSKTMPARDEPLPGLIATPAPAPPQDPKFGSL